MMATTVALASITSVVYLSRPFTTVAVESITTKVSISGADVEVVPGNGYGSGPYGSGPYGGSSIRLRTNGGE